VVLRGPDNNILTQVGFVVLAALGAKKATNDSAMWRSGAAIGQRADARHLPSFNSESTSRPGAKAPLRRSR
jgi:hypothetical protein